MAIPLIPSVAARAGTTAALREVLNRFGLNPTDQEILGLEQALQAQGLGGASGGAGASNPIGGYPVGYNGSLGTDPQILAALQMATNPTQSGVTPLPPPQEMVVSAPVTPAASTGASGEWVAPKLQIDSANFPPVTVGSTDPSAIMGALGLSGGTGMSYDPRTRQVVGNTPLSDQEAYQLLANAGGAGPVQAPLPATQPTVAPVAPVAPTMPIVDSAAGVRPFVDSSAGVMPQDLPPMTIPGPTVAAQTQAQLVAQEPTPFRQPTPCELGLGCTETDLAMRRGLHSSYWRDAQGMPMSLAETAATARMMAPAMQNIMSTMQGSDNVSTYQALANPELPALIDQYQAQGMDYASALLRAQNDTLLSQGANRASMGVLTPRMAGVADQVAQQNLAYAAATGLPYESNYAIPGYNPFGIISSTPTADGGRTTALEMGDVIDPSGDPMLTAILQQAGQYGPGYIVNRNDQLEAIQRAASSIGMDPYQQARIAQMLEQARAAGALADQRVNKLATQDGATTPMTIF